MTKLISVNDRIPVQIDEITIHISPLTYMEKMRLQEYMVKAVDGNLSQAMEGAVKAIKFAVKHIEGVETLEGYKYKLDFEENGKYLTDSCVDDLLNLPQSNKLIVTCSSLLDGIPSEGIKHPETGEFLEGISVGEALGKSDKPKKASGD